MNIRTAMLILTFIFGQNVFAQTCPTGAVYDTNVGVFSSTDPSPAIQAPTLYGIGGTGIINGSFEVCRQPGVELGSRIDARGAGLIAPEPGTSTYIVPMGDAGGGEALWNYTGHLDFAYAYGVGVAPLELGTDLDIAVQVDCDPLVGVVNGPLLDTAALGGIIGETILPQLQLLQLTQNIGFPNVCDNYGGFDPTVDGSYEFTAVVYDGTGAVVVATNATAVAGTPPTAPGASISVPTLSQWSLILLSLLLGVVAFTSFQRRT